MSASSGRGLHKVKYKHKLSRLPANEPGEQSITTFSLYGGGVNMECPVHHRFLLASSKDSNHRTGVHSQFYYHDGCEAQKLRSSVTSFQQHLALTRINQTRYMDSFQSNYEAVLASFGSIHFEVIYICDKPTSSRRGTTPDEPNYRHDAR